MAVRVRKSGDVVCAAMFPAEAGDLYIDDGVHYLLSVEKRLLVTDARHLEHGWWWWHNRVPDGITIDPFYLEAA